MKRRKYLGAALATVGAADEFDMATAMLVPPAIPALKGLQRRSKENQNDETWKASEGNNKGERNPQISPSPPSLWISGSPQLGFSRVSREPLRGGTNNGWFLYRMLIMLI